MIFLKEFHKDEDGAVIVDWVVLTAALVGLAIIVMVSVGSGVSNSANDMRRCQNQIGNVVDNSSWSFDRKMRVIARRCRRL